MADAVAEGLHSRHPLQRLESPSRGVSAIVHIAGLASFANAFLWLKLNPNPINDSYGWHLQYLTIIGLSLASLTFLSGLLADITLSPRLFLVKNALSVTSAPMEVLISILYWGLQAIDPKLVLPDWAPPLPLVTDIAFHAAPSIFLATDLLFLSPPYTIAAVPSIVLSLGIAFLYWFWVELCYAHNGFYPYPIFEALSTPWRVLLFTFSALLMALSTWSLTFLYKKVNGRSYGRKPSGHPVDLKAE